MNQAPRTKLRRGVGPPMLMVTLLAGCGGAAATGSGPATTDPPPPTSTGPTTPSSGVSPAAALPISVQSDGEMEAAGNNGPSSSILVPTSCRVTSSTATASGTYQGGLAPYGYARYGDVVELYVYTAPSTGYAQGIDVADLNAERSSAIGGHGPWQVTVPIEPTLGQPESCVVAAQPTHDFQGAP